MITCEEIGEDMDGVEMLQKEYDEFNKVSVLWQPFPSLKSLFSLTNINLCQDYSYVSRFLQLVQYYYFLFVSFKRLLN